MINTDTILVSVCVPVYNVSRYIEHCVRSLMEQTHKRMEYIFVDDCSTDDSIDILKKTIDCYPQRENIKILRNDRNHGLAFTRRESIMAATGEYIICVDSDDFVEKNMADALLNEIIRTGADIVYSDIYVNSPDRTEIERYTRSDRHHAVYYPLQGLFCSLCGAIFKKQLFQDPAVFSPEGQDYLEDKLVSVKLALITQNIKHLPTPLYHYCIRAGSITSAVSYSIMDSFISFWQQTDYLLQQYRLKDEFAELTAYCKVRDKASLMLRVKDMDIRKKYADLFREEENTQMQKLKRGTWLMSWLVHHHLWFLIRIYQIYIDRLSVRKVKKITKSCFHLYN
ncbi:MAG: glycosyltransferase family 2 protein [Paludibacteraceae bacterium]|nr:glycosyltransferase family 2 protein [Paludibacteraceae bacterium]